jgi:protein gp37
VSLEPLLEPVNILGYLMEGEAPGQCGNCGKSHPFTRCPNYGHIVTIRDGCDNFRRVNYAVDWVIAGGESGPKARAMKMGWIIGIYRQCMSADVPLFFKQWGEWIPYPNLAAAPDDTYTYVYVGKRKAGRMLDGKTHLELPRLKCRS